jgi:hypothetical protein
MRFRLTGSAIGSATPAIHTATPSAIRSGEAGRCTSD